MNDQSSEQHPGPGSEPPTPTSTQPATQESAKPAPSKRRLEANRRNAAKSTGPKTAQGKAASRDNALKHGLCARRIVIPGEDESEFRAYEASIVLGAAPANDDELDLARRIARAGWHLDRADYAYTAFDTLRIESSKRDHGFDRPGDHRHNLEFLVTGILHTADADTRKFERYHIHADRAYHRYRDSLRKLQNDRRRHERLLNPAIRHSVAHAAAGQALLADAIANAPCNTQGGHPADLMPVAAGSTGTHDRSPTLSCDPLPLAQPSEPSDLAPCDDAEQPRIAPIPDKPKWLTVENRSDISWNNTAVRVVLCCLLTMLGFISRAPQPVTTHADRAASPAVAAATLVSENGIGFVAQFSNIRRNYQKTTQLERGLEPPSTRRPGQRRDRAIARRTNGHSPEPLLTRSTAAHLLADTQRWPHADTSTPSSADARRSHIFPAPALTPHPPHISSPAAAPQPVSTKMDSFHSVSCSSSIPHTRCPRMHATDQRLVIFDLDGTLIDSKLDLAHSVNAARAHFGLPALDHELIYSFVGNGAPVLIRKSFEPDAPHTDVDAALDFFIRYYHDHRLDYTKLYPGVMETLDALAADGARMAILTNKPVRISNAIVEDLGIAPHFVRVYGGNSFEQKKPDPIGIHTLLAETGASPELAIMVGDSAVDIRTARNAGIASCGVTFGFQPESLLTDPPDYLIHHMRDLLEIVRQQLPTRRIQTAGNAIMEL